MFVIWFEQGQEAAVISEATGREAAIECTGFVGAGGLKVTLCEWLSNAKSIKPVDPKVFQVFANVFTFCKM
jgi:hypothetical protein